LLVISSKVVVSLMEHLQWPLVMEPQVVVLFLSQVDLPGILIKSQLLPSEMLRLLV
jgi:hypothetical protein